MLKKQSFSALLSIGIILSLSKPLYSQEENGEIIIISERVGEIINLEEKNKRNIFSTKNGFKSGVHHKLLENSYIWGMTSQDEKTSKKGFKWISNFRVSPWVGINSIHKEVYVVTEGFSEPKVEITNVAAVGGRIRFYLSPLYSLEINYGGTDWFAETDRYEESVGYYAYWVKKDFVSCGFFIPLTHKWLINPFVAWGCGVALTSSWNPGRYLGWKNKYERQAILNGHAGVEIPLTHWLSLEGRLELIDEEGVEDTHFSFQLALTIGRDK